ncbi:hypothetical protein CEXT_404601 [Caerostris extrusa]|uniref:Uncharacterized protein n=1 Tax=Caerostris extrusa TaxID=172846 RepID=A0AAV4N8T2_CAEEX|nr:hypothetical protein CEXT_404601 [Caerostris extrusa]
MQAALSPRRKFPLADCGVPGSSAKKANFLVIDERYLSLESSIRLVLPRVNPRDIMMCGGINLTGRRMTPDFHPPRSSSSLFRCPGKLASSGNLGRPPLYSTLFPTTASRRIPLDPRLSKIAVEPSQE